MRNKAAILFLSVLAFLPFCYACMFALPFADDFCFGWTASENISFLQKFLNQYLDWNGRYTSDVLVNLHPLVTGKLWVFRASLLVGLVVTPIAFYLLFVRVTTSRLHALTAAIFASVFYFNYLPDIAGGQYSYIGMVNYHAGNVLLILQVALLLHLIQKGPNAALSALSLIMLVACLGCNEIGAFLVPLFYFAATVFAWYHKNDCRKILLLHFIIALGASAFVFLSPGNAVRGSQFTGSYQLLHSLLYATLQTARFAGKWSLQLPFACLTLLLAANGNKLKGFWLDRLNPWVILGLALFSVFAGAFFPYFATGILGQHRTINLVLAWYMVLWMLFVACLSRRYMLYTFLLRVVTTRLKLILILASVGAIAITGNCYNILTDAAQGNFITYQNAFQQRQDAAIKNPNHILPLTSTAATFKITDAKADSTYFVDKCMRKYYVETGLQLK